MTELISFAYRTLVVPAASFVTDLLFIVGAVNGQLIISTIVQQIAKNSHYTCWKGEGCGLRLDWVGVEVSFGWHSVRGGNPEQGLFTENVGDGPHWAIFILRSRTWTLCLFIDRWNNESFHFILCDFSVLFKVSIKSMFSFSNNKKQVLTKKIVNFCLTTFRAGGLPSYLGHVPLSLQCVLLVLSRTALPCHLVPRRQGSLPTSMSIK